MEITSVVLSAYSQLGIIEDDIRGDRVVAALNKSERLIRMLADHEESIRKHPNYLLIQKDIANLSDEAAAMHSLAYGSDLIRSHPFGAVIHLGNHFVTQKCLELEPLRRELLERAYETWTGSDWINDRDGAKIKDSTAQEPTDADF